jgi:hypothetical protein
MKRPAHRMRKSALVACLAVFPLPAGCAESTVSPEDEVTEETPQIEILDLQPEIELIGDTPPPDIVTDLPYDPPDATDIRPDEGPLHSSIGGPCTTAADCDAPEGLTAQCLTDLITIIVMPGGYCTAQCQDLGDCGPGAACVDLSIVRFCIRTCSSAADCRQDEGYYCDIIPYTSDPNTYCVPPF